MLAEFAGHYRVGDEVRRRVMLSLFYPAALLAVCFGTFAILANLAAGGLIDTFRDFGMDLPAISAALVELEPASPPPVGGSSSVPSWSA